MSLQQVLIFSKHFLECRSIGSLKMSDKLTTAWEQRDFVRLGEKGAIANKYI
ncbi:hypothetical protein [Nostoc commune]|uniref:hypothetical protein n=1 Tax=Nostoc commune TaxID=1178 RepID=UPI0018C5B2F6|nr:hypothetical protein [Nostoc commune]